MIMLSCTTINSLNSVTKEVEVVGHDVFTECKKFTDFFSVSMVKPLESKREALLSDVRKIVVDDSLLFVYNKGFKPCILVFDSKGNMQNKIGDYGHAKNEYVFIDDFTVNKKNKEVIVMSQRKILKYDYKGNFLERIDMPNDYYYVNIETINGGYICISSYITEKSPIVHYFDENFNLISNGINSLDCSVSVNSLAETPLLSYNGKVCYYDFFRSRFIFLNSINEEDVKIVNIISGNMMNETEEFHIDYRKSIEKCDFILSQYYNNNQVFGWMFHNQELKYYSYNLKKNKMDVFAYGDWRPEIMCEDKGFYYSLVKPTSYLNMINDTSMVSNSNVIQMFEKSYKNLEKPFEKSDNYILIKAKRK